MTDAENYFRDLVNEIPDAAIGKMFGSLCYKMPNGKAAAMFWKDNIVVKLSGIHYEDALRLEDSKLFEPMEGRPMREWVQISYHYKDRWKEFALLSAALVKEIIKKPAKAKIKKK